MSVTILTAPQTTPMSTLGPYGRADYCALPDETRCQLIYGRLYFSPSPIPLHQETVGWIYIQLAALALANHARAFIAPMDVALADHSVVQPDVLYLAADRKHFVRERIEGPPTLVVEILSPSTVHHDRGEKQRLYAESGVDEYWIVDPHARTFEAYVADESVAGAFVVALPEDGAYTSAAHPELTIDTGALWAHLDQLGS